MSAVSSILQLTADICQLKKGDRTFRSHGICIIQNYDTTRCNEQPDRVVQEFLEIMNQS
ncbi:hypothetical protein [Aerosakkonema funiforme]|uniref:Uncharacterized protein n=1 Tax=Aerosakkonema funiforme FACHB-1375 TaxID=2949571 RepID=A0A926VKP4_9CYAN|nr:hypothetical protein [Aerosakkonema funiforme]MBD2185524.1 hypothetical protein [Aerosakkonema funiforme FACHB-1375]